MGDLYFLWSFYNDNRMKYCSFFIFYFLHFYFFTKYYMRYGEYTYLIWTPLALLLLQRRVLPRRRIP